MIRGAILFALAALLLMSMARSVIAQHQPAVEIEHRFTALETTVAAIATDVRELKDRGKYKLLEDAALALLTIFGGYDVAVRRKKKPE